MLHFESQTLRLGESSLELVDLKPVVLGEANSVVLGVDSGLKSLNLDVLVLVLEVLVELIDHVNGGHWDVAVGPVHQLEGGDSVSVGTVGQDGIGWLDRNLDWGIILLGAFIPDGRGSGWGEGSA